MLRKSFLLALAGLMLVLTPEGKSQGIITQPIDESVLVTLAGNTRPEANSMNDLGPVADSLQMDMYLQLKRSPGRDAAAAQFVESLTDKASPNFHKWITAAEYGRQFGAATSDIAIISGWLVSQGFTINNVPSHNMVIEFSGTAGLVKQALHTEIHNLQVGGTVYFANMSDPQIPAALFPAVAGVVSLNNFKPQKMLVPAQRQYTIGNGLYPVVPGDLATIYNLNPAFAAGYTGLGQSIVVVEDTDLYNSPGDWQTFRQTFGLAAQFPSGSLTQAHPSPGSGGSCTDPGINGDDDEAAIDVEWASAAAPNAAIIMASCEDTTNFGGFIALQNILTNGGPLPSVVSISYGESETESGAALNSYINALYQTAAAEGVSVFVSSGDSAAAGNDRSSSSALFGVNVSGWASTAYNVAVGGTDFGDVASHSSSTYWNATNGTYYNSANSYVPEIPWNNSCGSTVLAGYYGFTTTYGPPTTTTGFCLAMPYWIDTIGGSGGPSGCATGAPSVVRVVSGTCAGYAKPSYQAIFGNPSDGVRDIPDVALFASNGFWNHYYVVCLSTDGYSCAGPPSDWAGFGGTSVSSPIMAGIQALINQAVGTTNVGNPNPIYYTIGANEYSTAAGRSACNSAAPASNCSFNDVTLGTMDVTCGGAFNCFLDGEALGVLSTSDTSYAPAFGAAAGWDFATGIGSVNAFNLLNAFVATEPPPPTISSLDPTSAAIGTAVTITGTNFGATQGTSTVTFNGITATPSSWSATSIVAPVPEGASNGLVVVTANGLRSNGVPFTVLTPTPDISSLNPSSGAIGTTVTITGTNFGAVQGNSTVTFNGTAAAPTSWSDTSIVVNVPAAATSGNVVVTVNGTSSNGVAFTVFLTPAVTSIFPDNAVAGGPAFTLSVNGSNFQQGAVVSWNGTALATTVPSCCGTSLTASVPQALIAATGTASIIVTNPGASPSNSEAFTVVTTPVTPVLTEAYPTYSVYETGLFGEFGLFVSGTGFEEGVTVSWNGTNLGSVTTENDGFLEVPNSLAQTPGPITITVTNPGSVASQPISLSVPALRTLTSISPVSVAAGGSSFTLTVNGSGFVQGDEIAIAGSGAGISFGQQTTLVSSTELQTTVPASDLSSSGTLQVWVSTLNDGAFRSTNELPLTVGTGVAELNITKTHTGSFVQGEQNATYTITVSNASGVEQGASSSPVASQNLRSNNQLAAVGPKRSSIALNTPGFSPATTTNGQVTVYEYVPFGMTLVSMVGDTSWDCSAVTSCTRSDALAGGASYPALTVTVNVSPTASSPLINLAEVASGGSPGAYVQDVTLITGTTPAISSLSPAVGAVGTPVTVAGAFFGASQGNSTVTFNGIPATVITWSPTGTGVLVTVPSGATSGNVVVTVNGVASNGVPFTMVQAPGISGLNPTSGAVGTPVTITGTNFGATQGTSTVTFNGTAAFAGSWSATSIVVDVPFEATTGNVVVTVNGVPSNGVPFTVLPAISSIFPDNAIAGGPAFTLYVSGSGFQQGAVVTWNGMLLATTVPSCCGGNLSASVPASLIAATGTASIVVTNPGGPPSNTEAFMIVSAPVTPTLTSAFPSYSVFSTTGLYAEDLLFLSGSGFEEGVTISWNGVSLGSVGTEAGALVLVPSNLIRTPGQVSIVAQNPGSAPSQPVSFTIPPLRTLTTLSPTSVSAGSPDFTLTVNGTGFAPGDTIGVWGPTGETFGLATTFISDTELQTTVPASFVSSNSTLQVWVNTNGSPGDFSSINQLPVTVGSGTAELSVTKTHASNFVQGQQNATYTVTVSNASGAGQAIGAAVAAGETAQSNNQVLALGPKGSKIALNTPGLSPATATSGAVTVTDNLPAGMTLVSMAGSPGSGWSCSGNSCTRSDSLAGGSSYSPITVTVNVSANASSPETNEVNVSGGGALSSAAFDVTIISGNPNISGLSPTSGAVGTSVTITGANFGATQGTSTVTFNGKAATPTSWGAGSIVVPVPTGATSGNVVVTVNGVPSNGVAFTVLPAISSLTPDSGAVGTPVTIAGTSFGATQGTSTVTFHGTAATPTSWSATKIVVNVPAGATNGNVVVTVKGAPSNGVPFTVLPTPDITRLSPTTGAVGTQVTITGTNFGATQGTSTVKFNGTAATPSSWSATSIVVKVPTGATTGNVVVTVDGVPGNGVAFTVIPKPDITKLTPNSGAVGTQVTITGTNFGATKGTSTVTFHGTAATPGSWSATSIVVKVPTGATTGNVVVTVEGVASNGVAFTVP